MSERVVQTWRSLVMAQADCMTCNAVPEFAPDGSRRDIARLRRWARQHAIDNPDHHAIVETTAGRSYQTAPVVARPAPQTEGERDHETD